MTALDDWFAQADALLAEIDGEHGAETGIDPEEGRTSEPSGTRVRLPPAPPDNQVR